MDGLALIEAARLSRPETHAILMTMADQDEVKERSRNRLASFASFTKPFSIETFLSHIDRVLTPTARPAVARQEAMEQQAPFDRSDRHKSGHQLRPALSLG
jgi:DNA-binding NtrC family response regulator